VPAAAARRRPADLDWHLGAVNFSTDAKQTCLYITDLTNFTIYTINRANNHEVARFGTGGRQAGNFHWPTRVRDGVSAAVLVAAGLSAAGFALQAQTRAEPAGEWRYIGGDAHHTRYSALDRHLTGVLPSRPRRQDWRAHRQLGSTGSAAWFSAERGRRHAAGPGA